MKIPLYCDKPIVAVYCILHTGEWQLEWIYVGRSRQISPTLTEAKKRLILIAVGIRGLSLTVNSVNGGVWMWMFKVAHLLSLVVKFGFGSKLLVFSINCPRAWRVWTAWETRRVKPIMENGKSDSDPGDVVRKLREKVRELELQLVQKSADSRNGVGGPSSGFNVTEHDADLVSIDELDFCSKTWWGYMWFILLTTVMHPFKFCHLALIKGSISPTFSSLCFSTMSSSTCVCSFVVISHSGQKRQLVWIEALPSCVW